MPGQWISRGIGVCWLAVGVLFAPAAEVFGNEGVPPQLRELITVVGIAEERVSPDTAYLTVFSREDQSQADTALRLVKKQTDRIIERVLEKCKGVKDPVVKYEKIEMGTSESGNEVYSAIQRIRFSCAVDEAVLAEVIYVACEADAILDPRTFRAVYYGLQESPELTQRMEENALADAAQRAARCAALSGRTIGRIISVEVRSLLSGESTREFALWDGFPTAIIGSDSRGIFISYSLSVTYELLP